MKENIETVNPDSIADLQDRLRSYLNNKYSILAQEADDIIQEAWKNIFKTYPPQVTEDFEQLRPLIFTIVRHLAIARGKKMAKQVKQNTSINHDDRWVQALVEIQIVNQGRVAYNGGEHTFLKKDVEYVLELMVERHPNYVFIIQAFMQYELIEELSHEKIVEKIAEEYDQKFNLELTKQYYGTIKKRALRKFAEYWHKK